MGFNRRRLLAGIATGCAVVAFGAYFICCDPMQTAWAPQCWFHRWTGWKCPGCGTQRALFQLFHLHPGQAFRLNPLLFVAVPYLCLLAWLEYFGGKVKHPLAYRRLFGRRGLAVALTAIFCYWIGRNLAGF